MSDAKNKPLDQVRDMHPGGRRCCGRLLSEKCSPEEEASRTDTSGDKSCCKGHHKH